MTALVTFATLALATGAFVGLIAGMAVVLSVAFGLPWVAFLWHNLIGAVAVVVVGMVVSLVERAVRGDAADRPATTDR